MGTTKNRLRRRRGKHRGLGCFQIRQLQTVHAALRKGRAAGAAMYVQREFASSCLVNKGKGTDTLRRLQANASTAYMGAVNIP